jgi:arabinose-5-phosphate isomerase
MNQAMYDRIRALATKVIRIESSAILALESKIDINFVHACNLLFACTGKIIILGIGKSGHIGRKIAATFASTGSPAFFIHPTEAAHGDLGMISSCDVIILISNSGETPEILTILPIIRRLGAHLIAMTGNINSTLAKEADVILDVSVTQEACPLGLAPTASTTATLVMGDALAIVLLDKKGFTVEDFARSHPAGTLGKRLLLRVMDVMHTGVEIPQVKFNTPLTLALVEMTRKHLGMTAVTDNDGKLVGVFTDGDLRRTLERGLDIRTLLVNEVMTHTCHAINPHMLAAQALQVMEANKINGLLVTNETQQIVGALNMHDLLRAKIL